MASNDATVGCLWLPVMVLGAIAGTVIVVAVVGPAGYLIWLPAVAMIALSIRGSVRHRRIQRSAARAAQTSMPLPTPSPIIDLESSFAVELTADQVDSDLRMGVWAEQVALPVINSIEETSLALAAAVMTKDVVRILDVILPFRSYLNEVEPTLPPPPDADHALLWDRVLTLQHRLIEETIRSTTGARNFEPAIDAASEAGTAIEAFAADIDRISQRYDAFDPVDRAFPITNYDGGCPSHPTAEKSGTLALVGQKWELHFAGARQFAHGGLNRYPMVITESNPYTCHVTMTDTEDLNVTWNFDLPDTPGATLRADLFSRRRLYDFLAAQPRSPRHAARDSQVEVASPPLGIAEEIAKLGQLRESGLLTDEEFAAQKAKLLRTS
jgi:hypothetical protein